MDNTIIFFSHLGKIYIFKIRFLYLPVSASKHVKKKQQPTATWSQESGVPMRVTELCIGSTVRLQILFVPRLYVCDSCAVPRGPLLCTKFLLLFLYCNGSTLIPTSATYVSL
jgi:hypothetical protein